MHLHLTLFVYSLLLVTIDAKGGGAIGKVFKGLSGLGKAGKGHSVSKSSSTTSRGTSSVDSTSSSRTSSTTTTQYTCASTDTACNECALAAATVDACSSAIGPMITAISDDDLAKCLCYDPASGHPSSLVWVAQAFDVPYSACPSFASTALDQSSASDLKSGEGFCSKVGNVLKVTSTNTQTIAISSISNSAALSSALKTGTTVDGSQTDVSVSSTGGAGRAAGPEASALAAVGAGFGAGIALVLAL